MEMCVPAASEAGSTLAVILASNEPLLFLSADQKVIAASTSFCMAFDLDHAAIIGRPLRMLGQGEWAMPQLAALLRATASGKAHIEAYEINLERPFKPNRSLVLHAQILEDGHVDPIRLLLAITDVTTLREGARFTDDLIHHKAIVVQEVQHRVANSLQMIASMLMQGARHTLSSEARNCLQDAHRRVLSVAAVQRQLATSDGEVVAIRPYLTRLCEALAATMIADRGGLSLSVTADDSHAGAAKATSIGLIVTELVINAMKHAFPDRPNGSIRVDYAAQGADWTLSVTDDGIGMPPADSQPGDKGLGTGIIAALCRNLNGTLSTGPAHPGTTVKVSSPPRMTL